MIIIYETVGAAHMIDWQKSEFKMRVRMNLNNVG